MGAFASINDRWMVHIFSMSDQLQDQNFMKIFQPLMAVSLNEYIYRVYAQCLFKAIKFMGNRSFFYPRSPYVVPRIKSDPCDDHGATNLV